MRNWPPRRCDRRAVRFATDLLARPIWTFFKMYLLRQGFREGLYGLLLCGLYVYYTFLEYARLWEMKREWEMEREAERVDP